MTRLATLVFLLTLCFAVNANPIEQWSYNLKASQKQIAHEQLTKKIMQVRQTCINKAEMGEQLALKKIGGTTLNNVLTDIIKTHESKAEDNKMPWYLVLEMQRLARDAYREKYNSTDDVDNFVLALYHSCLSNGG